MKLIFFIACLLACIASGAGAWDLPKIGPEGSIEEMRQMQWVKEHTPGRQYASLSISIQGQCVHDCLRPIDGKEDAVQISRERTSRPDEYLDMPTSKKDMERYGKGN